MNNTLKGKTYIICSYGGCGSKLLTSFISKYYNTIHLHDSYPPVKLTKPVFRQDNIMTDFHFSFNEYVDPNDYVVVYIYRNPVDAFLSRGVHPSPTKGVDMEDIRKYLQDSLDRGKPTHTDMLLRKWTEDGKRIRIDVPRFVSIDEYVSKNTDIMNCRIHFDNYMKESDKNYQVIGINYDTMMDNLEDVLTTLNIDFDERVNFPTKKESEKFIPTHTMSGLVKMYQTLIDVMRDLPCVSIIKNKIYES